MNSAKKPPQVLLQLLADQNPEGSSTLVGCFLKDSGTKASPGIQCTVVSQSNIRVSHCPQG